MSEPIHVETGQMFADLSNLPIRQQIELANNANPEDADLLLRGLGVALSKFVRLSGSSFDDEWKVKEQQDRLYGMIIGSTNTD